MDIYCPRCGEPTDITEITYLGEIGSAEYGGIPSDTPGANVPAGSSGSVARKAFLRYGCEAFGLQQCEDSSATNVKAYIVRELGDLFRDDLDGFASDLADAEAFGLL
jgi:hypothetical protein